MSGVPLYRRRLVRGSRIDELVPGHNRINVYPSSGPIEAHASINQRKNRVIAAQPDILSRQKFCPALTHDDIAGNDPFAAEFFNAQPLADAVAAILNAALSFFVSHRKKSLVES